MVFIFQARNCQQFDWKHGMKKKISIIQFITRLHIRLIPQARESIKRLGDSRHKYSIFTEITPNKN